MREIPRRAALLPLAGRIIVGGEILLLLVLVVHVHHGGGEDGIRHRHFISIWWLGLLEGLAPLECASGEKLGVSGVGGVVPTAAALTPAATPCKM